MEHAEIVEIIKECLNGRQEGFCKIVQAYQKAIYRFCFQFTRTRQDAEDAATDIFIKIFRSLESFDREKTFTTWMYRIAYNHMIDITRKKKIEFNYLAELMHPKEEKAAFSNPEEEYIRDSEEEIVRKFLEELPAKYKTVLVLRYYEDFSYQQIGEILHKPIQTVGSLVLRGKQMLRKKMGEGGH